MKELTEKEIQWLEAFAKKHEFFASFLLHYKLKQYLSNNQYYWLHIYINQAEEQGDTILSAEENKFMKEFSETNEPLSEILKIYEDKGFLDKTNYEAFLEIKLNITGKAEKAKKKYTDLDLHDLKPLEMVIQYRGFFLLYLAYMKNPNYFFNINILSSFIIFFSLLNYINWFNFKIDLI